MKKKRKHNPGLEPKWLRIAVVGDCGLDDSNVDAYPFAAVNETAAETICFVDADGDGYASIESGGNDCNDQQRRYHYQNQELLSKEN